MFICFVSLFLLSPVYGTLFFQKLRSYWCTQTPSWAICEQFKRSVILIWQKSPMSWPTKFCFSRLSLSEDCFISFKIILWHTLNCVDHLGFLRTKRLQWIGKLWEEWIVVPYEVLLHDSEKQSKSKLEQWVTERRIEAAVLKIRNKKYHKLFGNNVVLFQIWPSLLFLWLSFIYFSLLLPFFLLPILADLVVLDPQYRLQRNTRFTIFKRGPKTLIWRRSHADPGAPTTWYVVPLGCVFLLC
jgi:hypothetical protein